MAKTNWTSRKSHPLLFQMRSERADLQRRRSLLRVCILMSQRLEEGLGIKVVVEATREDPNPEARAPPESASFTTSWVTTRRIANHKYTMIYTGSHLIQRPTLVP